MDDAQEPAEAQPPAPGPRAAATAQPRHGRRRPARQGWFAGRAAVITIVAAIVVLAAAGVTWVLTPGWGSSKSTTTIVERNVGVVPTEAPAAQLSAFTISPNRIEIPRISAVAPIVTVAVQANRELDVPLDPKVVGWWAGGAKPGAKKGTAILDGHINYAGVAGVLATIGTLNPGDKVYIYGVHDGKQTKLTFAITGVRVYSKQALPYQQIFDQSSIGRLAIVTCGGPFDASTGNYRDNIVAFAVPA
jgi:hypothetical protein